MYAFVDISVVAASAPLDRFPKQIFTHALFRMVKNNFLIEYKWYIIETFIFYIAHHFYFVCDEMTFCIHVYLFFFSPLTNNVNFESKHTIFIYLIWFHFIARWIIYYNNNNCSTNKVKLANILSDRIKWKKKKRKKSGGSPVFPDINRDSKQNAIFFMRLCQWTTDHLMQMFFFSWMFTVRCLRWLNALVGIYS